MDRFQDLLNAMSKSNLELCNLLFTQFEFNDKQTKDIGNKIHSLEQLNTFKKCGLNTDIFQPKDISFDLLPYIYGGQGLPELVLFESVCNLDYIKIQEILNYSQSIRLNRTYKYQIHNTSSSIVVTLCDILCFLYIEYFEQQDKKTRVLRCLDLLLSQHTTPIPFFYHQLIQKQHVFQPFSAIIDKYIKQRQQQSHHMFQPPILNLDNLWMIINMLKTYFSTTHTQHSDETLKLKNDIFEMKESVPDIIKYMNKLMDINIRIKDINNQVYSHRNLKLRTLRFQKNSDLRPILDIIYIDNNIITGFMFLQNTFDVCLLYFFI